MTVRSKKNGESTDLTDSTDKKCHGRNGRNGKTSATSAISAIAIFSMLHNGIILIVHILQQVVSVYHWITTASSVRRRVVSLGLICRRG